MSNIARLILFFSLGFSVSLTLYAGKNINSFLLIGAFSFYRDFFCRQPQ